jgi:predicted porin
MNKKLVAVAVAGMLAAPLAAQAQTANVTLYGRLNLSMEVINAKQDSTQNPGNTGLDGNAQKTNTFRVTSNSSRLGVRGSEALGGGLSAIFQIESAVSAANGGGLGSTLGTRETFVGLQAGWGTVKLGYFLTPYDDIHPIFGNVPTLATSILGTQALWSNTGWSGNYQYGGAFDDRAANSLRYDSPNIAGFTGSFQIGTATAGGDPTNGPSATTAGIVANGVPNGTTLAQQRRHAYLMSVNGLYNNGPFSAGIAYEIHNNFRPASVPGNTAAIPAFGCVATGTTNPNTSAITPCRLQDEGITVAASWNFGVVKIGGVFEQLKYDVPSGDIKRNFWGGSVTWNLGPGQLYAMYGNAGNGSGSALDGQQVGAVRKGDNTGAQQWQVSYTYALSKRTLMYAGYVQIANRSNGAYNFGVNQIGGTCLPINGQITPACGSSAKPQGLITGLVHFF